MVTATAARACSGYAFTFVFSLLLLLLLLLLMSPTYAPSPVPALTLLAGGPVLLLLFGKAPFIGGSDEAPFLLLFVPKLTGWAGADD
jgi:hypothetical protein